MDTKPGYTLDQLAREANVGIESIRYYQQRNLLPILNETNGGYAVYPPELIDRLRFISRGLELGFTVDEIHQFLQLADGSNREAIQDIANKAISEIRSRIVDLRAMESVLSDLLYSCKKTGYGGPCPIIEALRGQGNG
jgi:MerR family mercuric resistance operon transcriptional regulator